MRLRRIAERQRAAAVAGIGERNRVVAWSPSTRSARSIASYPVNPATVPVKAPAGRASACRVAPVSKLTSASDGGGEFDAAAVADLAPRRRRSPRCRPPARPRRSPRRAGVDDRVRPGVDDQRVAAGRLDTPSLLRVSDPLPSCPAPEIVLSTLSSTALGVAAEHDVLAVVGQDDLPAAGQGRAAHQDLEVGLVAGRARARSCRCCRSCRRSAGSRRRRPSSSRHCC